MPETYETLTEEDFDKLRELVADYKDELWARANDESSKSAVRSIFKDESDKARKLLVRLINSIPTKKGDTK